MIRHAGKQGTAVTEENTFKRAEPTRARALQAENTSNEEVLAEGCAEVCGGSARAAGPATRLGRLSTRSQSEDLLVGPVQEVSERRSDTHPDGES